MNPTVKIISLFLLMVAMSCTGRALSPTPVPDYRLTYPPTATLAATATRTPTATPSPTASPTITLTPTRSPTPTTTPDPATICQVPGEDGRIFVIGDEELQEHDLRLEAKEALREAIRREYPGWAEYSQQLTFGKMVVTHDLARILLDAGYPCIEGPCPYQISVNPQVILTVMATQYGDEPPPGFDAWQTANQIDLNIKRLYESNQARPEVWQDRFTNAGSYVIYEVLGEDEGRLQRWCVAYHILHTLTRQIMGP